MREGEICGDEEEYRKITPLAPYYIAVRADVALPYGTKRQILLFFLFCAFTLRELVVNSLHYSLRKDTSDVSITFSQRRLLTVSPAFYLPFPMEIAAKAERKVFFK